MVNGVKRSSGQANIVMMVLVLFLVFGMFIFLLMMLQKPPESPLDNMYAHNMLLSIMRSDTGYPEEKCKTVADAVACAFFEPYYKCGDSVECARVADNRIADLLGKYSGYKQNNIYYIEASPEGRVVSWMGSAVEIKRGDQSAKTSTQKSTAEQKIQKLFQGEPYTVKVKLYMADARKTAK